MAFIENFVPTSKMQLKRVCFAYYDGDIKKAQEMYDYYSNGIDLPDRDPVPQTLFEQIKSGASDIASFIKNNQNEIAQGYNIIRAIINKDNIPIVAESATEELPPINEEV